MTPKDEFSLKRQIPGGVWGGSPGAHARIYQLAAIFNAGDF